ncbi:MAG TPA: mechanosensitive ion channel family protein [Ktedonobacterales bacterium]
MGSAIDNLAVVAFTNLFMTWILPAGTIIVTTLIGWIAERLVIRWARRLARGAGRGRESVVAGTLRGHITFWGLLFGLGLDSGYISPLLPVDLRIWYHDALLALFIASLTLLVARLAVSIVRVSAVTASRPVISLISNVVWFVTLLIGALLVLSLLNVNIAPWLTALGVGGLAVSLALQATLTDLISGMLLLGAHQITIGHYIKLSTGEEGYITDITWRTTTIRQLSNNEVIVPNSKMTSTSVTNFHTPQMKTSVLIDVPVGYSNDLDHVTQVTVEVGEEVMRDVQGGVPDFTPLVRFNHLGTYGVRFTAILQCQEFTDQYLIKSEFIRRLRQRYEREGITAPAPILAAPLTETVASGAEAPARTGKGRSS